MNDSVFFSYSHHEGDGHIEQVHNFAAELSREGVDVIVDRDAEDDIAKSTNWIDWMSKGISESEKVIIVLSKKYIAAYNGTSDSKKDSKGINHEIKYIKNDIFDKDGITDKYYCIYFDERYKEQIPVDFSRRSVDFFVVDRKQKIDLISKLPKLKNRKIKKRLKSDFSSEFIEFINRTEEKQLFKGLLLYKGHSGPLRKGSIVQVSGPPQIGKTAFINRCFSEESNSTEEGNIRVRLLELNNKIDSNSTFYGVDIFKLLLGDEKTDKDLYKKLAKNIDARQTYLILYVNHTHLLKDITKSVNDICVFFSKTRKYLHNIRFSPEKSDIGLVIEARQPITIKTDLHREKYHLIDLQALNRADVESAIENYLNKNGKVRSEEFTKILDATWEITHGLPGAIKNLFTKLEKESPRIYDLYDSNETNFISKTSDLFSKYVKQVLISPKSLKSNRSVMSYTHKVIFIKKLCCFRFLDNSAVGLCLRETNEENKTSYQYSPSSINEICKSIFFVRRSESSFSNSIYLIDPSIREVLLNYFYPKTEQKIIIHKEKVKYYKEKFKKEIEMINNFYEDSPDVIYSKESRLNEIIWHETERLRISKNYSASAIIKELREDFSVLFSEISNENARELLIDSMRFYYNFSSINSVSIGEIRNSFKRVGEQIYDENNGNVDFDKFPLQVFE